MNYEKRGKKTASDSEFSIHYSYFATEPPAFSIAAFADAEREQSEIISFLLSAPRVRIFTRGRRPFAREMSDAERRVSGLTVLPGANARSRVSRWIGVNGSRKLLSDCLPRPRSFGMRFIISRISGYILCPARAVWPFP